MFDTKFAVVLREDLEVWQKLNVTAFLSGGIIGQKPELIGEPYRDYQRRVRMLVPLPRKAAETAMSQFPAGQR